MKFNKKAFLKSLYKISVVLFLVGYNFAPSVLAIEQLSKIEDNSNQSVSATTEEVPEKTVDTSEDIIENGGVKTSVYEEKSVVMKSSAPQSMGAKGGATFSASSSGKWTWVDKPTILVPGTLDTNWIKWDNGVTNHSGLEFIGKNAFPISGEQEFELGTLKHHNFPVNKAIEQAKLAVTINLGAPISQTKVFNMDLTIEETLNSYPCPSWHTTGNPACDDRITFPTVYSKEFFEIGDTKYVLEITGFIKGGQNVTSFITKERTTNEAIIRGRLRSIPAKVTICDRTNSDQNPYVVHTPSVDGIWTEGHDGHNGPIWYPGLKELGVKWGDIIPEFRYFDSNGDVQVYGGKNNGEYGLSILENGCVFPEGKITVNKEIIAPAGVSESFDITGTGTHSVVGFPSAFNGFKGTNKGTISPTTPATFNVYPGKYTFNETAKEGWIETGNTCNDVVVEKGDDKSCTITNTQASTLTIVKHAEQVSETEFNFTTTGNGLSNFSLVDNDANNDPKKVFTNLLPGNYSVTEENKDGWDLKSAVCDNGQEPDALTLEAGSNVTCTFTNTQQGSLTIVKKALPFGTDSFGFTLTGKGVGEQFNLVDNSDTEDASETFSLKAGTYAVVEDNYSDWKTTYSCTGNNTIDNIVLEAGKSVTCTFTNTKYGSISGRKLHDLDGLASTTNDRKPVQGYTIFIDTNKDGKLDPGEKSTTTAIDGSYSFTGLEPGEYTVVEVMKLGWIVLPGTSTSWTIKLSPGENRKGVDFINIEKPTIEVIKFVDIDGDGKVDVEYATDWTWKLDDKEYKMFGKEDKPMEILPGTYTISEIQKDGYHVKSMMCDNGGVKFFEEPTESTKLTINSGDKILCRFTNTRDTGTLIVRKEVINDNGGKRKAGEFSFKIGTSKGVGFDQDPTNPLLGENRFEKYPTGTYSIIEPEANTRGYATTYDNCDKIVVEKGKEAVCTITNDDVAPTLTVIKKVVNDNGGTATANDFGIKLNGDELKFKTWPGEVGKYTSTYFATPEVKSNTKYELEEIDHPGYKEGKWSCKDDKTGKIIGGYQFSLTEGQRVTCTITNDDIAPSLELVKEVDNKYGGDAQITDWTLTATGPTTIFGDGGVKSKDNFKAGTYTLSETAKEGISGYEAGDWDCTNDIVVNDNNQITLEVGQTTVCTIKNTEIQPTLTLVKKVENNHGGSKQVVDFKLYIGDTEVTSGEANKVNSGVEYTVSEDQLPGYTASTWGGDCSADGKITLNSGENKTCTITNSDSQSKITVIKKVINDHGGTATVDDFNITLTDSTLEFDAGVEEGDTITYTATVFGDVNKEYTLSETVTGTGYDMESLECTLGSNGVFTLPEGKDVTCTIVNNDIQPTLTVKKVVDNGRYGDKQVSDFTLYVSGNEVTSGKVNKFNAGDYTVREDNLDGYVATFSGGCDSDGNVTLNVGDNKVCTITNRSTHGKIIIKKLVEPRGDKTRFTFTGDLTGTIGNNGTIEKVVIPGDYSVTEQFEKGWNLKSLVCDDTDSVKDGYTANIKVGDNETVTCTFTNEKLGSISGFKYEDRNGNGKWDVLPLFSELPLRGWTIFIDKNDNGVLDIGERFTKTNILGYYEFNNLPVGETYIIREVQKDGWTQTSANPAPITIAAGDVRVFVNFGNFKDATINVTKDVVGVDGKTNVVDTHEFTALLNNNEDTGKTIAEGTTATYNVANGRHTISEVEDENYTTLGCFIGKKEFTNYSVRSGETYNVVCKNAQKPATINVTKNVVDVNGDDVVDTTHFKSILTDEDGNQVAEEQKIGEALPPATYTINTMGLYTISEPYSQFFENLGCTILSEGNEVPFTNYSVRSGGKYDVVCTNKQKTATIEVTKDVVGINGEEVKDPTEFTSILSDSDGNQIGEGQIAEGIKAEYKINEMGRYTVSEISDEDYENLGCTVLQSNGEEVLFENYRVRSGGRYRVTCKNAQLPATLIVTKDVVNSEGEDVDGDIFSDDQFDVVLGEETQQIADTANGKKPAIFEGLQPGVHTFTETPKEGYTFGGCTDDGEVTLGSNQTLEVECTNKVIDPILQIEKSNDKQHIDQYAGDIVTYTITVTAPDDNAEGTYVLNNVVVSDIAPAGFKYISGTWTVQKNGVDISVPEPTYDDKGQAKWNIGDMQERDEVVLTYKTRISLLQDPGNYPDIAWVEGKSLIDGQVLGASTVDPETPFVGTDVTVIEPVETEEGEVLGASITLPVTGASTYLTLGALIMMILGAITLLLKPFKKLSYALLTGLMAISFVTLLTPNRVLAANEDINVRIMQPATPTNKSNFNVGFVALDLQNRPVKVECYKEGEVAPFATFTANTGNCPVTVSTSGTYKFYVKATADSDTQTSDVVTVVVDLEKPAPVIDYSKAGNVIKFKTPNDPKIKTVEIHRSDKPSYTANESTRIHPMPVSPNTEYSWTDTSAEAGKTYYYALRTVDALGNVSSIVSDPEVVKVSTVSTPTATTTTTSTATSGEVAGEKDTVDEGEVAGETDDVLDGDNQEIEKTEDGKEKTDGDVKETVEKAASKWYIWVIAIVVLGGVAYYVRKQKRN